LFFLESVVNEVLAGSRVFLEESLFKVLAELKVMGTIPFLFRVPLLQELLTRSLNLLIN
jgi:hypothetical protein